MKTYYNKTPTSNMTPEEQREQFILSLADVLRKTPFTFEFQVRKKPKGIKIIYQVTQEHLDAIVRNAKEMKK